MAGVSVHENPGFPGPEQLAEDSWFSAKQSTSCSIFLGHYPLAFLATGARYLQQRERD